MLLVVAYRRLATGRIILAPGSVAIFLANGMPALVMDAIRKRCGIHPFEGLEEQKIVLV
jgi:hypothetical protein